MAEAAADGDPAPQSAERAPDKVLSYVLETADVSAWEAYDPRFRRRNRAAYAAAVLSGLYLLNVLAGHFKDMHLLHSLPAAFAVLAAPSLLVWLLLWHDRVKRARARLAQPLAVRLEITGDRLAEWRAGQDAPVAFGARAMRDVALRDGAVFLSTGSEVIIVPRRAFASDDEMAAFAEDWAERMA